MIEPSVPFTGDDEEMSDTPEIDLREVQAGALSFALTIMRFSRTTKAGKLRLAAAEYLVNGKPYPCQIAARHGVTKRRVFQAVREVKVHLGLA